MTIEDDVQRRQQHHLDAAAAPTSFS